MARELVVKKRSREDQRRVGLHLTTTAVNMIGKAPTPTQDLLPEILGALPAETLQSLVNSLEEIIEQLRIRNHQLIEKPLSDM